MVGRTAELQSLNRWLAEALAGQPRLIFVSGEAGVGKSGLIEEFVRRSTSAHPELVTATGYCNAHFGHADPLLPFRTIATQLFNEEGGQDTRPAATRGLAKKARSLFAGNCA